jgi:hypothetical protein
MTKDSSYIDKYVIAPLTEKHDHKSPSPGENESKSNNQACLPEKTAVMKKVLAKNA